jgi:AAHS family 3-hydroxyphenylpropionic acid transporter
MPNFIALASEAVAPRRRLSAVTLVMAALPFGGALAGVMALGDRLGWSWRSIFIAGGIAPLALALIILSTVRSSQPGSGTKPKEAARLAPVDRVGTVLWKMNRAPTTLLLWTGFFFTQLVLFLMLNWLPTLIVGLGFSRAEASLASIGFNVAGGFGAAFLGRAHTGAHRWRWVLITYGGITAAMAALVAAATFGKAFVLLILACALAGSFIVGAQLILFALAPLYYPSANRGTGVGAAVAFGRLGSVAGPVFAATLLAAGRNSTTVLAGMVPFVVIAGCAALALTRRPESMD